MTQTAAPTTLQRNSWFRDGPPRAHLAFLILLSVAANVACILLVRFSMPLENYWHDANELLCTGRIAQHFEPSGYAALIAIGIAAERSHAQLGVEVEQGLLQVLLVVLSWLLMRRLGASLRGALWGGVIVALHPELLLTVTKVWDVSLSTLTLAAIVYLALRLFADANSWLVVSLLSLVFGFACFDRTNYLLLLLPVLFVLWKIKRTNAMSAGIFAVHAAVLCLLSGIVYSLLSLAVYRTVVLPTNGPYNLYAGQNPLSERSLLDNLNAEGSLAPSLRLHHMEAAATYSSNPAFQAYFRRASFDFVEQHPVLELRLIAVKLYTFLRADTKLHRVGSAQGAIKLLLAIPIPLWLGILIWYRRSGAKPWSEEDTFLCLVAITYVLPFLITNSDPRFRTPLDIVLIAHIAALLTRARPSEATIRNVSTYDQHSAGQPTIAAAEAK